jgi:hypothetical protein
MSHRNFRFLIAGLAASLTAFAAFPADTAEQDAPAIHQYIATFEERAALGLTLADNKRFIMTFAISAGFFVSNVDWVGNWQQKGARLCLTPDPPALLLYALPANSRPAEYIGDMPLVVLGQEERARAAFAWSPSGETPERFLKIDEDKNVLPLPAREGYLFVAHMPRTGDAPLDIQRYPVSPKEIYVLHYANLPRVRAGDTSDKESESMRLMQDALFLMLFAESREVSDLFFASVSGKKGEGEKLGAAIRKHSGGTPPYCGTLNTTNMKLEISPEIIRKKDAGEREAYAQWARSVIETATPHRPDDAETRSYTRVLGTPMKPRKFSLDFLRRCDKEADADSKARVERIWNCSP